MSGMKFEGAKQAVIRTPNGHCYVSVVEVGKKSVTVNYYGSRPKFKERKGEWRCKDHPDSVLVTVDEHLGRPPKSPEEPAPPAEGSDP